MGVVSFSWHREPRDLRDLVIESERLVLRGTRPSDADDIFREFDAEVTRFMGPKPAEDIVEIEAWICDSRDRAADGANIQLTIRHRETTEFLGCCGLHGQDDPRIGELGIWLKTGAHGNGYGREAIGMLVAWQRVHLDLDWLIYPVDRRNIPSRRIPERLGGEVFREGPSKTAWGGVLDLVVYRIPVD